VCATLPPVLSSDINVTGHSHAAHVARDRQATITVDVGLCNSMHAQTDTGRESVTRLPLNVCDPTCKREHSMRTHPGVV
jgi:hypothetical protein